MTARHGLWVANGSTGVTTPQDARLAIAALLSGPGILSGGAVTGVAAGPNMQYATAPGVFATARGVVATDGLYLWANDGSVTVNSFTPAPSSGTRFDLIWARAKNANDGFGDANSDPEFGVTVGVAGASPVRPTASLPAGALVLYESVVPTNAPNASTCALTRVAPVTVAAGGTVVSTTAPAMVAGLQWFNPTTKFLQVSNGTSWFMLRQPQIGGSGTIVAAAGGTSGSLAVVFGAAFAVPPTRVAIWSTGNEGFVLSSRTITTTGFSALATVGSGTNLAIAHNVPFTWAVLDDPLVNAYA